MDRQRADTEKSDFASTEWMLPDDRRMQLLAQIEKTRSIAGAARNLDMSYRAALNALDALRNLAGEVLLDTISGGRNGGGTILTSAGERLLDTYRAMQQHQRRFLNSLQEQTGDPGALQLLKRLAVKTSARNQFFGTVTGIRPGAVNAEVSIALNQSDGLTATITMESLRELQLVPGSEVWALVKAPSVMIMPDDPAIRLSARNRLCGEVSRITRGAVNSDVVIKLQGGGTVSAIITNDSLENLALSTGDRACAVFKAGSVILGVSA